jgi:glycosyltransferase involved in cell wall biosynthesis
MEPKITVIVPSFNVAPYIGKCLDSILTQTLSEIEVFVVDAYSTDGTREIIEEYVKKDDRLTLLDDIKKSTGYSKNIAIDKANAPYYAIVESDDYIEPDMFEKMYAIANSTEVDFVKANFSTFLGEDDRCYDFPKTVALNGDDYEKIINPQEYPECFRWIMFEWLGLYRVDFLKKHNIRHNESPGAAFQDTGFWFQTFAFATSVYLMRDSFYHYRCDNPYASVKDPKKALNICREYEYIFDQLKTRESVWNRVKSQYCRGFFYDNYVVFNRISEELKPELVSVVQDVLKNLLSEGGDLDLLEDAEREKAECLLNSQEGFLRAEQELDEERKNNEKQLLAVLNSRENTFVYGAGSYGANLQYYLDYNGYSIKAFVDGDSKKHGKKLNGKEIISLSAVIDIYKNPYFLVANKDHSKEIYETLINHGIPECDILICDMTKYVKTLI